MEAAVSAAFTAVPYRHPVLGWPGDLENLSRPQAQAYFKTYYAPNNALVVLMGDLDPAEVIRVAGRYFGDLPPQPTPPAPILEEPPQAGERRIRVEFPAEPQLLMFYQALPFGHPDTYPLAVLATLLGDGRSSRLHKRLVEEKRLATSISAGLWLLQYAGLFTIQATPRAPHTLEEVEAALEEEIAALEVAQRPRAFGLTCHPRAESGAVQLTTALCSRSEPRRWHYQLRTSRFERDALVRCVAIRCAKYCSASASR